MKNQKTHIQEKMNWTEFLIFISYLKSLQLQN